MAKKKMSCKEIREQKKLIDKAKYSAEQAERDRVKKEAEDAAEMEKAKQAFSSKYKSMSGEKSEKKSVAKAVGIKSVFAVDDAVYMTSFGKGNDAVLEKKIVSDNYQSINTADPAFTLTDVNTVNYKASGGRIRNLTATADNPLHQSGGSVDSIPTDMLCLKNKLEERFYGRSFDNDNIHIQLIYNILDIEKIIAEYATNAVYAIDNLFRKTESELRNDFVGDISANYTYDNLSDTKKTELKTLISDSRIGYFGNAFCYCLRDEKTGKVKRSNDILVTERRNERDCYDIFALIGSLRQWSFHGDEKNDPTWLYCLDSIDGEFRGILDKLYDEAVFRVNSDFVNTNKVNIQILKELFPDDKNIAGKYYQFLVTKKYKNIGFSIKKLREMMVENTTVKDERYDSVRSKAYKLIDFVIWHGYLHEDEAKVSELVNGLRGSLSDEEKERVYHAEALRLWKKLEGTIIYNIMPAVDGRNIRDLQKNHIKDVVSGERLIKGSKDVSYFTKLMYLLTLFIDGKEINDLLTTLINKFDNIRSFNETMKSLGLVAEFSAGYSFFKNSDVIFKELSELNSFAKMCPVDVSAKRAMYCDAIDVLGIESDMSADEFYSMINKMLCLDANGKPIRDKSKKDSGLRNFIANNVIESARFRYLIRYGNTKKIKSLAKSEAAVGFVLSGIPDEQIERYYRACHDIADEPAFNYDEKRRYLTKVIKEMSFEKIRNAGTVQKSNASALDMDSEKKRRYQAVVRLYLTVMYLMLKNLVNVNSRYVMGFHCLERDALYYDVEMKEKCDLRNLVFELMGISDSVKSACLTGRCDPDKAENAGNRYLRNKRWYSIIFENLQHADKNTVREFRNTAAHLNAIRNIDENIVGIAHVNSYFELYHYIVQRHIYNIGIKNPSDSTSEYLDKLNSFHTYNKDFVKAYCSPMAYNLVRYKNLTIDGLFDRNFRADTDSSDKNSKDDLICV